MYKKNIPPLAWGKILRDFDLATKAKKYKRVDYRTIWTKIAKPNRNVHIEVQENDMSIVIDDNNRNEVILALNDGALGEFLYDTVLFKEEKPMPPRNDNETLVYNTIASTLDGVIASSNVYNKTTADCVITAGDIAKVCDGLQSDSTSTTIDWNNYGTANPYTTTNTNWNIAKIDGVLSTRSYSDVDIELATRPTFEDVKKIVKEEIKNNNNEEKKEMKGFNFDFGPCTGDQVRMSMYGLAVKNAAGTYVSYNPKSGEIVDVDILNFDGARYMYKIPVAIKEIAVGDIIVHNRKPMFVTALPTEGATAITCVDVCAGEQKQVIPTVNMFGFNFVTKIVSLFNTVGDNAPTPDAPFGNMLPFMLMGEGEKIDPMMLMFMMGNGKMDMSNPMMMYFMLKDNKDDMLPLLFMMQNK